MLKIEFASYQFKIETRNGIEYIFDPVRKRWLVLTPEEWVRQNFLQYLLQQMHYPSALIAVEKEFFFGDLSKRCDLVVYDRSSQPWMIVECKQMKEELSSKTIKQVLIYHMALPAKYLVITNGSYSAGFIKNEGTFQPIEALPEYKK
jgi:hypothetical protein